MKYMIIAAAPPIILVMKTERIIDFLSVLYATPLSRIYITIILTLGLIHYFNQQYISESREQRAESRLHTRCAGNIHTSHLWYSNIFFSSYYLKPFTGVVLDLFLFVNYCIYAPAFNILSYEQKLKLKC